MVTLILLVFIFKEGIYLIGHLKTFNGLAAILWLVITASIIPPILGRPNLPGVLLLDLFGILFYYQLKRWARPSGRL